MKLYNKRDDFSFPIVNFQFIIATFQYISPLIGYSIACGSYFNFLDNNKTLNVRLNKFVTGATLLQLGCC